MQRPKERLSPRRMARITIYNIIPVDNIYFSMVGYLNVIVVFSSIGLVTAKDGLRKSQPLVSYFELVDADADKVIKKLPNFFSYDDPDIQTANLNVQIAGKYGSFAGSMYVALDEPNVSFCEREAPFTVFRGQSKNGKTTYSGKYIPAGKRTIKATPYHSRDCSGPAERTITQSFFVRPATPASCLSALRIFDGTTDDVVGYVPRSIFKSTTIELGSTGSCDFIIEPVIDDCPRSKIQFAQLKPISTTSQTAKSDTRLLDFDLKTSKARKSPYMLNLGGKLPTYLVSSGNILEATLQVKLHDFVNTQDSKLRFSLSDQCSKANETVVSPELPTLAPTSMPLPASPSREQTNSPTSPTETHPTELSTHRPTNPTTNPSTNVATTLPTLLPTNLLTNLAPVEPSIRSPSEGTSVALQPIGQAVQIESSSMSFVDATLTSDGRTLIVQSDFGRNILFYRYSGNTGQWHETLPRLPTLARLSGAKQMSYVVAEDGSHVAEVSITRNSIFEIESRSVRMLKVVEGRWVDTWPALDLTASSSDVVKLPGDGQLVFTPTTMSFQTEENSPWTTVEYPLSLMDSDDPSSSFDEVGDVNISGDGLMLHVDVKRFTSGPHGGQSILSFVFTRLDVTSTAWTQVNDETKSPFNQNTLRSTGASRQFLQSPVRLSNNGSVIAFHWKRSNSEDIFPAHSHIYIYDFNTITGTWTQKGAVVKGRFFGFSLAPDGNRFFVNRVIGEASQGEFLRKGEQFEVHDFNKNTDRWERVAIPSANYSEVNMSSNGQYLARLKDDINGLSINIREPELQIFKIIS